MLCCSALTGYKQIRRLARKRAKWQPSIRFSSLTSPSTAQLLSQIVTTSSCIWARIDTYIWATVRLRCAWPGLVPASTNNIYIEKCKCDLFEELSHWLRISPWNVPASRTTPSLLWHPRGRPRPACNQPIIVPTTPRRVMSRRNVKLLAKIRKIWVTRTRW